MSMNDINRLSHTSWNCKYHIVFAPKYRRKAFYKEKRLMIGKILRQLCEWKGVKIIEAEACPDHIHLFVEIPPKISVSGFIVETEDGRMVAVVDNDILANIDTSSWDKSKIEQAKSAAKHALSQFSDGIIVNGITRKVNKVSKKEFTRSKYTQYLANTDTGIFADKMRMADIANEVVAVTSGWGRDGGLVYPRNDNFIDFDHGTALVMAGENKYKTEVIVGITNRGEYVFYDVTNISPVSYKIKEESHTNATTDKSIGAVNRDSSEEMVSQRDEKVKQKNSREMDTVKALEKQNRILQERVERWKEQTRTRKNIGKKAVLNSLPWETGRGIHIII